MSNVNKLENLLAEWYKKAPRLPKNGQQWIATNAWWIALIGVIIGAIGILIVISATFFAGALLVGLGGYAGVAFAGVAMVIVLASLVLSVISLVLTAMAITPLKAMQKKGWTLIFMTVLLSVASQVVSFLLSYDVLNLIWGLIFTAIGAYFLFEVRSYFGAAKEPKKPAVTTNAKDA